MPYLSQVTKVLAIAVAYFGFARLGLSLAFTTEQVTTIWPPTGIAFAAVLLFGYRIWPGIALGAFFANIIANEPAGVALGISIGNTLEALTGVYLLKHYFSFEKNFEKTRDVIGFVVCAGILGTMVSATIGVLSLTFGEFISWSVFLDVWVLWWIGDMMGALLVAPFILLWAKRSAIQDFFAGHRLEVTAFFIFLIFWNFYLFSGPLGELSRIYFTLPYLVFPFTMWAAARLKPLGVITTIFIISLIAITNTLRGIGPFVVSSSVEQNLLSLQLFMFVMVVTGMLLASAVAEGKKADEQVTQNERRFRALIEHGSEAVCILNTDANILYASPTTETVLGYSPKEFIQKDWFEYVHPDDRERAERTLMEVVQKQNKVVVTQYRAEHKNGSLLWLHTVGTNLLTEPAVKGIVVNFHDITKEKEIDQAKSEFVSLASHQLRTPLSVIKWYSEKMLQSKERSLTPQAEKYLDQIYHANQRMIVLVDTLLDVSRLELGTFSINPEALQMTPFVTFVLDDLAPIITSKELQVTSNIHPDVTEVHTDPNLLHIVLQNLISNSVKYTPQGGNISIRIAPDGSRFLITVSDTGCGIPSRDQRFIFTKLFRAENAKKIDPDSTGLGLYILHLMIEKIGGRVWFTSEENHGSTFYVALPRKVKKGSR